MLPPAPLMAHESFSDCQWGFSTGTTLFLHGWKHHTAAQGEEGECVGGTVLCHPIQSHPIPLQQWRPLD